MFLYERGLDPYDGGIFHQVRYTVRIETRRVAENPQAPLLLPLFSLLPSPSTWIGQMISVLLFTALDILSADSLYQIAAAGAAPMSSLYVSPRKDRSWSPISMVAM